MNKFDLLRSNFLRDFETIRKLDGPSYLYEPIKYFIQSPGKRIRPIIVLFLCELFKNDLNDAKNGALGVELLHNFTLVHDDIMDEDELRHNIATIHKKWDNAHAVLSGDGLGALGPIFIAKIKNNTLPILVRYHEVILEICEGQAYDMEFEKEENVSVEKYLLMSQKKTGSLFEFCFEIPAYLSKNYIEYLEILKKIGRVVGTIFQIQDDILEISSNSENMGKGTDSDIKRKKKTILSCVASEKNTNKWNKFIKKIEDQSINEKKESFRKYLKDNQIDIEAKKILDKHTSNCNELITELPGDIQEGVNELIDYILNRKN
tara:strand:+ start:798 stop:1754 length:957 start_codon:yes stop_codon:yes gene_type:complete